MNGAASSLEVLLVDDSAAMRKLVFWSLGGPGSRFNVHEAGDAEQALELLELYDFDVMITDIYMPGMSGIELVEQVRGDFKHDRMRIIVTTSVQDSALQEMARAVGADDFLEKPFKPRDIRAAIDRVRAGLADPAERIAGGLTVQALLDSIPYLAMVLDENHHVMVANGSFYERTETGIDECLLRCVTAVHGDGGMPDSCPLVDACKTGDHVEREIVDAGLGKLWVAVYPLGVKSEDGSRLFLHLIRPAM